MADSSGSTASCFRESSKLRFVIIFTRVLFLIGVALVVAGISLEAQYTKPNTVSLGLKLAKAGFIVVTVIFLTLLGFEAYFWMNLAKLGKSGLIVSVNRLSRGLQTKVLMIIPYGIDS